MADVVSRVAAEIERIRNDHVDGWIAAVSHGDVIRSALLHCLGLPLDAYERLEVAPASVSVVELHGGTARVVRLNDTAHLE